MSMRDEPALATNWIKDQLEGLKLQNLALATVTGPAMSSFPKNITADVQHAINKCESLGSSETVDPSRESIGNCTGFLTAYGSPSTSFLPKMQSECCMILRSTLGGNFDTFAASGDPTAWVLL